MAKRSRPVAEPITLVVSVDTEEDNWAPTREGITVENIRELPRLDRLFERLGVRATYFTSYQVATTNWSSEIIRGLIKGGRAEVGAHLHPWNTPPIRLALTTDNTMLANLPVEVQRAKISVITDALTRVLGQRPYSFRAGRWGLDRTTVAALIDCGYRVDSSVTPFKSWRDDHGPSHISAPLNVYRMDKNTDQCMPVSDGRLVEVPVSWGYTHRPWRGLRAVHGALDRSALRHLGITNLAARLHVINNVVLSPEIDSVDEMLLLASRLVARGVRHLHVTFHSPTLLPGLTPFAQTAAGVDRLYANLSALIERIDRLAPVRFATVGEAAVALAPPSTPAMRVPAPAPVATERRLLVVSYHFPPDPAIGGLRWAGLTKYLTAHGWRSWIVTAAPPPQSSPPGVTVTSRPRRTTTNDLYRRLSQRLRPGRGGPQAAEAVGGPAPRESIVSRLRAEAGMLLSLPDEARGWILRAAYASRRLIARVRPTAVVSSGPPHSAHVAAWLATRFTNTPWFVDMRDPWAGPLTGAWQDMPYYRSGLRRWLTARLERIVMRSASAIICNTREFASALAARYPGARIEWVPNAVDRALLPHVDAQPYPGLGIAHVGTVYGGRDFGPLLVALRAFLDRNPTAATDGTRLRIAGNVEKDHADALMRQIDDLRLREFVEFLGMLPRADALYLVARSRLAVVLAQRQEFQVPGKLYEMVAMRVPTLVLASPESAATSEGKRLGTATIDPEDAEALVELMEAIHHGVPGPLRTPVGEIDYRQLATRVSAILGSTRAIGQVSPSSEDRILAEPLPSAEPASPPAPANTASA
jgi:glycosyltransferase involved in cell wall biosynthesis